MMDIGSLVVTLVLFALVGFLVWIITNYVPMPDMFKQVIIVACAVLIVLYLIAVVTGNATVVRLPR